MESFALSFASMLLALVLVLALAWLVLKLLRSRLEPRAASGAGQSGEALRYVRGIAVGAKERIVIVEHRGERWMLGVTAGGISALAHWGAPATGATATNSAAGTEVSAAMDQRRD